jgi:hypothetical protein
LRVLPGGFKPARIDGIVELAPSKARISGRSIPVEFQRPIGSINSGIDGGIVMLL